MNRPALRLVEARRDDARPRDRTAALEFAALGAGLALTAAALAHLPSWAHSVPAFRGLAALAFAFFAVAVAFAVRTKWRSTPNGGDARA